LESTIIADEKIDYILKPTSFDFSAVATFRRIPSRLYRRLQIFVDLRAGGCICQKARTAIGSQILRRQVQNDASGAASVLEVLKSPSGQLKGRQQKTPPSKCSRSLIDFSFRFPQEAVNRSKRRGAGTLRFDYPSYGIPSIDDC
jgi:hypothetical protein